MVADVGLCGFHGGPATRPCNNGCELCLLEASLSKRKQDIQAELIEAGLWRKAYDELEGQDYGPGTPLEAEMTWLKILAFMTVVWLLLGALGAGLTIAFTGTLWGALWLLPCAGFALVTVKHLIRVRRMLRDDNGRHMRCIQLILRREQK